MSKKYTIDENVGLQDMEVAMANENPEVGQCTVWHSQFAVALMFILQGHVAEALQIVKTIFGGKERGTGACAYTSPIDAENRSKDGFSVLGLGFSMVAKAVKSAASCALNAMNAAAICGDFIAFGRMFQEAIIDAAKKGGRIVIEYSNGLKTIALASRNMGKDDFNVHILWAEEDQKKKPRKEWKRRGAVEYICRDRLAGLPNKLTGWVKVDPTDPESKSKLWVNDPFWQIGKLLMRVVIRFAHKATTFEPKFSEKLLSHIDEQMSKDVTFRTLTMMIKNKKVNVYRTLTGAMRAELDNAKGLYWDKDDLQAHQKEIKGRYREQFVELGNEIRREIAILEQSLNVKFNVFQRVEALIWLSYHKDDGAPVEDQRVADNFADCALEAEFAVFMLRAMKGAGEDVPEESRDKLVRCTIAVPDEDMPESGLEVDFTLGYAEVRKGNEVLGIAESESNLNGTFIIRKINGKFYACQNIEKKLVSQIPAADMTRLQFVTAGTAAVGEKLNDFISRCAGKEVTLCRKVKDENGNTVDNAVVFDGNIVSRFRPAGTDFAKDKFGYAKPFRGKIMKTLDSVYDGYVGTVVAASTYKVTGASTFTTSVITLENVHRVEPENVEVKEDFSRPVAKKAAAVNPKEVAVNKEKAAAYHCSFFD